MIFERILFNILAFALFIIMFFKMVKKNDSNYIALLAMQALGIAISFFELMNGTINWTLLKSISYLISVFLPIAFLYLDNKNINMIEKLYVLRAKLYILINNNTKAKKILIDLVSKYSENYMGHKLLAEIYEKEGGMRKAIDEYVKAIDINKKDYESYYKIANLLNNLTKKDEAIEMLENLLKIKPDASKASLLLGDLLIEKNRYKEAINLYLNSLKYAPDDYDLYYNLGIAYTHLNDFKNAKTVYEKAAEINHYKYKASYSLGKISLIYNDINSAEKYFTQALYGEEVEAMSYYELAKIYMIRKEKEKVILFLEKAIELDETYVKKLEDDTLFIPIKAYVNKKQVKSSSQRKKLSKKEQDAKEHLDSTFNVVEKLNDLDREKLREKYIRELNEKQRE